MARPSSFTKELGDLICLRIADGESLRSICREEDMPGKTTVFVWLASMPEFRDQYARARSEQADTYVDEIVDIADDGTRDYSVDDDGKKVVDHDHIQRAKLRIDARKWVAARLAPKKYGESNRMAGDGDGKGTTIVIHGGVPDA